VSYNSCCLLALAMTESDPLNTRKSPRQSRSAATVEAILEAAARILETEGLGGYSTNAIARRAGVSIGSLYQYFPSKDAVTRALTYRRMAGLAEDIAASVADEGLEAVIRVAVTHQLRRPVLARLLDAEEDRLPPDPAQAELADGVKGHLRSALGPKAGPEATGDVMAIIRGMVDAAGARGETDPATLMPRVRRAVLGYLGTP
jgi:AcrR family transcriptional regulator